MATDFRSPGINKLPFELRLEYEDFIKQAQDDIAPVEGAETVLKILLERFSFVYSLLRYMERDLDPESPRQFDMQRYNQATSLWIKIASGLLTQYAKLYEAGAVNDLFVKEIIAIVAEEVDDPDVLERLKHRLISKQTARSRTIQVLESMPSE
jgi:hypothetical protein